MFRMPPSSLPLTLSTTNLRYPQSSVNVNNELGLIYRYYQIVNTLNEPVCISTVANIDNVNIVDPIQVNG
ncbi:hypothetical protein PNOK_0959100 [Pyrrhoderma noxium]|uniref:Uncharacterized protein n=1 Tax=Pyrrhoderma noxium TaxID=2282107 RepID=A0A286U632_9AGAM|nr:hypothetical protein PNOK_0959100 [Pyrrhoderma noxium]